MTVTRPVAPAPPALPPLDKSALRRLRRRRALLQAACVLVSVLFVFCI
jgi:hypothetical protein